MACTIVGDIVAHFPFLPALSGGSTPATWIGNLTPKNKCVGQLGGVSGTRAGTGAYRPRVGTVWHSCPQLCLSTAFRVGGVRGAMEPERRGESVQYCTRENVLQYISVFLLRYSYGTHTVRIPHRAGSRWF